MNCGDVVSAEAGKEGEVNGPSTSCRVLLDDGELLYLSRLGAYQGWTASLLSLPALEHHLVDLGVFVDVDRLESTEVSQHAPVL